MNLTNLHQSLQGIDLGVNGSDIILRNLFQQIELAAERYEPQSVQWETDILHTLRLCQGIKRGVDSAEAYVLSIIEDRWDDMSIEFRKRYDYQYDVLVLRETGVQPSTMDNYTRAARAFFGEEGAKPMGLVEVTKYDQFNQPIKKDGEFQKEYVEFDPKKTNLAKLCVAAPLARQGKLTQQQWNMLADNQVTPDAFKKAIYNVPKEGSERDSDPSLRFTLEGDRLVAHEFGESVEIAELYFDMYDNELARTAIRRMLLSLQVPHEQDVIARMGQRARDTQIIRTYGNQLIIPDQESE